MRIEPRCKLGIMRKRIIAPIPQETTALNTGWLDLAKSAISESVQF